MVAELTVISWREVPLQVTARSGRRSARTPLPERLEEAWSEQALRASIRGGGYRDGGYRDVESVP